MEAIGSLQQKRFSLQGDRSRYCNRRAIKDEREGERERERDSERDRERERERETDRQTGT
jgi:hypothetical protein